MSAYEVLEVASDCSPEELKASYKRLILAHHPDKNTNADKSNQTDRGNQTDKNKNQTCDDSNQDDPAELFNRILAAWRLVSSPEERKKYDMTSHSGVFVSSEACTVGDFQTSCDGTTMSKPCRCGDFYEVQGPFSFITVYSQFSYSVKNRVSIEGGGGC